MNGAIILWVLVLVQGDDLSEHKTTLTRAECIEIGRMIMDDKETPFDGFFCDKVEPATVEREIPACTSAVNTCT